VPSSQVVGGVEGKELDRRTGMGRMMETSQTHQYSHRESP